MKMKNFVLMAVSLMLLISLATSAFAANQNVEVEYIKINGDEVALNAGYNHEINHVFELGEDLDIRVKVSALQNAEDVQIDADIKGYRYSNEESELISDSTSTFNMDENDTITKDLELQIPMNLELDYFNLRIRVSDRFGESDEYAYSIHVDGASRDNAVVIKDYSFTPSNEVYAGRPIMANVKVKNYGERDLDDIKVTVSIPELNVKDVATLDELDADETETFEDLLVKIPVNAQPGDYVVNIEVEYDEYESTMVSDVITVTCYEDSDVCGMPGQNGVEQATLVNVPSSMELTASGAAFPITIKNNGESAVIYSLSVSGVNWGTWSFDPAADFIVEAGDLKTVYLYIAADEVEAGEKYFKLQVKAGEEINEVALSVNVSNEEASGSLRNALEIGLIVLVVILIIIGLIIGFSKLKDNKNDDEAEAYY